MIPPKPEPAWVCIKHDVSISCMCYGTSEHTYRDDLVAALDVASVALTDGNSHSGTRCRHSKSCSGSRWAVGGDRKESKQEDSICRDERASQHFR